MLVEGCLRSVKREQQQPGVSLVCGGSYGSGEGGQRNYGAWYSLSLGGGV